MIVLCIYDDYDVLMTFLACASCSHRIRVMWFILNPAA